jgi:hypothetical protein
MGCFASLSIRKEIGAMVNFALCISLKRADLASVGKDNLAVKDPLVATMNFDCRDGSGVSKGTIRHEFGHVLGFLHEYV